MEVGLIISSLCTSSSSILQQYTKVLVCPHPHGQLCLYFSLPSWYERVFHCGWFHVLTDHLLSLKKELFRFFIHFPAYINTFNVEL